MTPDKNIKRKYLLQNYDPNWTKKFDEIKLFLQSVFQDKALKIEHVGSTSIPKMKAKPIIDVLVVIEKMEDFAEQKQKMISAGYEWGENYIAPNTLIFYKMADDGSKTENIHICESGSPKEKQFLVMRNFFCTFPEKAKEYGDLKEKNFALHPDDYPAYREAKTPFLQKMEQEAYQWNTEKAFLWIMGILERNKITYKISGGFAARIYGVNRELADIDIGVYDKDISIVASEAKPFIKFGPARYKDNNWDLELLTLVYEGQEIDIAGAEAKIFNHATKEWENSFANLNNVNLIKVYGKNVRVEILNSLVSYKSKLARDVDLEDVKQLLIIKAKETEK